MAGRTKVDESRRFLCISGVTHGKSPSNLCGREEMCKNLSCDICTDQKIHNCAAKCWRSLLRKELVSWDSLPFHYFEEVFSADSKHISPQSKYMLDAKHTGIYDLCLHVSIGQKQSFLIPSPAQNNIQAAWSNSGAAATKSRHMAYNWALTTLASWLVVHI